MVERRNVIGGGLAASVAALMAPAPAEGIPATAAIAAEGGDAEVVARAVRDVRDAISTARLPPYWATIGKLRTQQHLWMRTNHRYPDFIEVGISVWDALYDWHVHYQQPINMVRSDDGRYVMAFMFTTFILRPDAEPDYVGPPFDAPSTTLRRP